MAWRAGSPTSPSSRRATSSKVHLALHASQAAFYTPQAAFPIQLALHTSQAAITHHKLPFLHHKLPFKHHKLPSCLSVAPHTGQCFFQGCCCAKKTFKQQPLNLESWMHLGHLLLIVAVNIIRILPYLRPLLCIYMAVALQNADCLTHIALLHLTASDTSRQPF